MRFCTSCVVSSNACAHSTIGTKVGFDLVNIQIPPKLLEPSLRNRVEWRHGNLCVVRIYCGYDTQHMAPYHSLTTKLPFEDDEFDHVHIQAIAKGVPENKVYCLTLCSLCPC